MTDVLRWLVDDSGFTPRAFCGTAWTDGLRWLHAGSDLLIGLAYVAIPTILLFFLRKRAMPFSFLIALFGAFILACGTGHLIESVMFQHPVYHLSGAVKAFTAAVSWVTVVALIPAAPRVIRAVDTLTERPAVPVEPDLGPEGEPTPGRMYFAAALAAVLGVVVRAVLDPFLEGDQAFVIPLLAVVAVAWYGGLGPALVALLLSMTAVIYWFVEPRNSFVVAHFPDQLAVGLFLFAGVACATLGEAQKQSRRRAAAVLQSVMLKQAELEAEVSRRERAEADRQASEAQFRVTADALPQLAWQARPDGHIYWYNRRWYEYTGTTPAEMEGWGWKAVHDPAVLPAVMDRWQRSLATGNPFDMVFPLRGADGTFRPFLTRVEPVRGADGRVVMWVGSNTDVSDQRRAEEVARESEARFRMVAEAVPQIVWVTRPDGFHEYYNPRWYEYTGMTEAESRGFGWSIPLHPDDRARSEARWKLSTDTGEPYEIEYRFRGADGAYRWFLGRALPQRDEAGTIVRWFGTCTDIDEFKRLRETLLTSEARYRHLTESIPQLVWTCRPDGWCDYLSRQWVEYTGVPMADQLGWAWVNVLHGDDRDRAAAAWKAAVEDRAAYDIEYRIRRHDGEYRWFRTRGGRVRGDDEAGGFWLGTCTDIHDQKEHAATLEAMVADRTAALTATAEELQRSNGELEKFAYVASHDLQEPLRKIQAFGDRLGTRFKDKLDDQGRDYLDRMQASAGRMRQLINDLLAFSRVTTKTQPFSRVDLNKAAADAVDDLHDRIQQTGGAVDVGPLPAIDADPTQARQLLQNLIGNGLKFHKPGEPPRVTVRAEAAAEPGADGSPRGVVRLTVADNGIGFDEKYLDRIFQVFQRLHGRGEYDGTGVGLAICRKIVDRHGGAIAARSSPGRGATFVVTLPLRHPPRATP